MIHHEMRCDTTYALQPTTWKDYVNICTQVCQRSSATLYFPYGTLEWEGTIKLEPLTNSGPGFTMLRAAVMLRLELTDQDPQVLRLLETLAIITAQFIPGLFLETDQLDTNYWQNALKDATRLLPTAVLPRLVPHP